MKIKVYEQSCIEEELEKLNITPSQARVIGAIVRGVAGDIIRGDKHDEIKASVNGRLYRVSIDLLN